VANEPTSMKEADRHPTPSESARRAGARWLPRAVDAALVALLLAAAFLLGCCELYDADVWWHLAGGRWILEHHRAPGLDPFSFGSADRVWVDLNWLFQVVLAVLYDRGGLAAVILLAAAAATAALAVGASARGRSWPVALGVLAWIPALVLMSSRFRPRPEVFTLLYLAGFLGVLWRAERRPALLWVLVPLQILWVNTHGLFVLGPLLLGFYALDKVATWAWRLRRGGPAAPVPAAGWKHLAGAAAVVVFACLANPYFLDGALFPLELLPKVTAPGNVYKQWIEEFYSPRTLALREPNSLGPDDPYTRALVFLLLLLPASFSVPAAWAVWSRAPLPARRGGGAGERGGAGAWLGAFGAAAALSLALTAALPGRVTARWLTGAEFIVPAGFVLLAAAGAHFLRRRSPVAAVLALLGGVSEAAWATWLYAYLTDARLPAVPLSLVIAATAGAPVMIVITSRPGGLFRLLLVGAFGYLALNATRNGSLFGLVGGAVLAWNLGEWVSALGEPVRVAWGLRAGAAGLLGLWVAALATDRYYGWTRQLLRLGLGDNPFLFAHEAARFAGREGMPDRAFVSDFRQSGVYIFHNGPARKPFIDPRLELPDTRTFARDLAIDAQLHEQEPAALDELRALHVPLVLLFHAFRKNGASEAFLWTDGDWRCIYFDAVAGVFVRRNSVPPAAYPDVDFAARLFRPGTCPVIPDRPGAALREARALWAMGNAVRVPPAAESRRTAVLLGALGRAQSGLEQEVSSGTAWAMLGECHRKLLAAPPAPLRTDEWDPARIVSWAQATYCYCRAVDVAPDDSTFLTLLYNAFWARAMYDAQLAIGERLVALGLATPEQQTQIGKLYFILGQLNQQPAPQGPPAEVFVGLLKCQQPEAALRLAEEAARQGSANWAWPATDQLAITYLHMGRPADARQVWEQASPPAPADRLCRLATTFWVERDFPAATHLYREALAADPRRAEAWWGLAMIHTQKGQAGTALEACRNGLRLQPSEAQRAVLQQLEALLPRYATSP
jgi:tetratricopeptide (TPR) repeat protein